MSLANSDQATQPGHVGSTMRYASLSYSRGAGNLGDNIQSIAAEQFLPEIDARIDRDFLRSVDLDEEHLLIMNGWFCRQPDLCFPPSPLIRPVFFGFHLRDDATVRNRLLDAQSLTYFKRHEPIGCRDQETTKILREKGIDAFYSKCLTLTFPRRSQDPVDGKVIIVDADQIPIPHHMRQEAVFVTHRVPKYFDNELRTHMASALLRLYRDRASIVITTRLHCALPCLAMGIPVIFFGSSSNKRAAVISDLGVKINPLPIRRRIARTPPVSLVYQAYYRLRHLRSIDWNPAPKDVSEEKEAIIHRIQAMIAQAQVNSQQKSADHAH